MYICIIYNLHQYDSRTHGKNEVTLPQCISLNQIQIDSISNCKIILFYKIMYIVIMTEKKHVFMPIKAQEAESEVKPASSAM